jgi:hypothetical protein
MVATLAQQVDETFDQLDNIETLCKSFFDERQFTIYKNISASLRLLLTGSSGQPGLAQDVLPVGRLSALRKVPDASTAPEMIVLPAPVWIERGEAKIQIGNGTATVQTLNVLGGAVGAMQVGEMFDDAATPLPLHQWLQQPFLRPDWTLRTFLTTVANKDGGAHFGPNAVLEVVQKWGHFQSHLTAGIARSVLPQIRTQLLAQYPHHVRSVR